MRTQRGAPLKILGKKDRAFWVIGEVIFDVRRFAQNGAHKKADWKFSNRLLFLMWMRALLVGAVEDAAGDDLGLNFAGPFEDVENACVTQDAADWVFQCKAVAAVDL